LRALRAAHVPLSKGSHASSFNPARRVADSSPTRSSYRRGGVDGHRVYLGRLGDLRTATKLADEQADAAVVVALTPSYVEKFLQNSDAKANLAGMAFNNRNDVTNPGGYQ
jgi:hypothetical protein